MKTLVRPGAWVLLLMGFALVLAACLNDPENKEGDKTTPSTVETPVEEVPPPEAPQTPVEAPVELPETKELQVAVEGETMNVPASLTRSELGYAFYLLEGFEFTPEEPGKDMVFHKEFGEFFLRIEPLGADTDVAELRKSAEEGLRAVGDRVEDTKDAFFDEDIRSKSEFILHAGNASGSVTVIALRVDDRLFRLTLNFPLSEAAEGISPRFYPMIRTIALDEQQ